MWISPGFIAASMLSIVSPGPDNLAIVSIGLSRGRAAAIAFGLGCGCGCVTHTTWAALGVTALIAATPAAFFALKLLGAAYLTYLGVMALQSRGATLRSDTAPHGGERYFLRGFVANAINPKVALFFFAFLPQFVPAASATPWRLATLGLCFAALACLIFSSIAYCSGLLGRWLRDWPGATVWLDRLTGALFLSLATLLVVQRR